MGSEHRQSARNQRDLHPQVRPFRMMNEFNFSKITAVYSASQHGIDLVGPLSNILNRSANRKNDLAASLALDAIVLLCNSNTVNIASTWSAVKNIFTSNRQHRTVKRYVANNEHQIPIQTHFSRFPASAISSALFPS